MMPVITYYSIEEARDLVEAHVEAASCYCPMSQLLGRRQKGDGPHFCACMGHTYDVILKTDWSVNRFTVECECGWKPDDFEQLSPTTLPHPRSSALRQHARRTTKEYEANLRRLRESEAQKKDARLLETGD